MASRLGPADQVDLGHLAVISFPKEPLGFPLTRPVACAYKKGFEATAQCLRQEGPVRHLLRATGTQMPGQEPVPVATCKQGVCDTHKLLGVKQFSRRARGAEARFLLPG